MVAARDHLPDLPALVYGQQWRRYRRSARHRRYARLSDRAGRRRALALADLSFADGRLWLRCSRLYWHPPPVRHAGRLRRAHSSGTRARAEADVGLRAEPHIRPAPLVRRIALLA